MIWKSENFTLRVTVRPRTPVVSQKSQTSRPGDQAQLSYRQGSSGLARTWSPLQLICESDLGQPAGDRCLGRCSKNGFLPSQSASRGRLRLGPQIKRGEDPEVLHLRGSRGSGAMKPLHREVLDKGRPHRRRNDLETIGLAVIGRQLGEELVVRNTRGCRQLGLETD